MADDPPIKASDRALFRRAAMGTKRLGGEAAARSRMTRRASAQLARRDASAPPSADDQTAFAEAMTGVIPLQVDRAPPHYHHRRASPVHARRTAHAGMHVEMFGGEFEASEVEMDDELWFARPGLQHKVLRRLRRGKVAVGAELDLHGLVVAEAHRHIDAFIQRAQQQQIRCVRIIHGKGLSSLERLPVLKGKVDLWLRRRDDVLAFASARPEHGGTGAVYVLLKGSGTG